MDEEIQNLESEQLESELIKKDRLLPASIFISAIILAGAWVYTTGLKYPQDQAKIQPQTKNQTATSVLEEKVLPSEGITLPVRWGDLGAKMVSVGVIDGEKFEQLYAGRGGLPAEASAQAGLDDETKSLLYGESNGNLKITSENSGMILNLLWALALGTKNDILETGPMSDPRYGGAGNFASTGGWTLAKDDAIAHYSRHPFVVLTPEQQQLVERVSKNIYRPCCNNPTHFPDCNHGMAMLGLLELMASQGVLEEEMYKAALKVNSYWFPDTYMTIAKYLEIKGAEWEKVDPKEILGKNYSSLTGFQKVLSEVTPSEEGGGGSCGV